jgi:hypothetical protein
MGGLRTSSREFSRSRLDDARASDSDPTKRGSWKPEPARAAGGSAYSFVVDTCADDYAASNPFDSRTFVPPGLLHSANPYSTPRSDSLGRYSSVAFLGQDSEPGL